MHRERNALYLSCWKASWSGARRNKKFRPARGGFRGSAIPPLSMNSPTKATCLKASDSRSGIVSRNLDFTGSKPTFSQKT